MKRRRAILSSAGAVLAWPASVRAQPTRAVPRVGYVTLGEIGLERLWFGSFLQGLRELGYVDGQTIQVEQRHAEGQAGKAVELVAELVDAKVDILVTTNTILALIAKRATATIPIVATAADPVGSGLVTSLARPGGNITGVSDYNAELINKRLQLLKELAPTITHVAVLANPDNASNVAQLKDVQAAAPAMGVEFLALHVQAPDDIDRAFASMRRWLAATGRAGSGAVLVAGDRMTTSYRDRIAAFAIDHRLPTASAHKLNVVAGGLLSYGANFPDLYRRLATYVHRILKGDKAGDLPIEQPTRFDLAVNLKTARAIGIDIPPSILARADEVIE